MRIIYFDGHCNICNGFVDFLIRRDRQRRLFYAPLQGTTARQRLPQPLQCDLATMVLDDQGTLSTESSAALRSISHLGGVYSLFKIFLLIPRFLRDPVYRLIANHRYRIMGRRETCRLPSASERAQFLD